MSEDFFPAEVRPRRAPLRWARRRPLGWVATAYHGVYEIRPHLRHHFHDGNYHLEWRRGDGFTVVYTPVGVAEPQHVARLTTWFESVSTAKDAIRFQHDELLTANRAPNHRHELRPGTRVLAARAALRTAIARRNTLLQPALPIPSSEE